LNGLKDYKLIFGLVISLSKFGDFDGITISASEAKDWTQYDDVAGKHPGKLKELQDLFWAEAAKYQVLPLDATVATRLITPKPSLTAGRKVFTWSGEMTGTPNGDAPNILDSSYNFKAEVEIPEGGAEGMIVTQGGRFGGYGFYVLKGKPVFLYNLGDLQRYRWEGPAALSPGKHTLEFEFNMTVSPSAGSRSTT
jgi:hypothetical protein